jgi:hypothetical protein
MDEKKDTRTPAPGELTDVTPEVGDEGGSPGDVEVVVDRDPGPGSEAGETWQPRKKDRDVVVRDETGVGKRSP